MRLPQFFRKCWFLPLGLLMAACSTTYRLTDSHGQISTVEDPSFGPDSRVDFLIGDAIRPVKAGEIITLQVRADQPLVREGRVFYPVKLMLEDSVQVPESGSADSLVFMDSDGYLEASHGGGTLRIRLAELRTLYRYEPPKDAKSASDSTALQAADSSAVKPVATLADSSAAE